MQIWAAAALVALAVACGKASGPVARVLTRGGEIAVVLEVADTREAQQRGLMYRSQLPEGHGMLFVFGEDADHEFWMKNTLIPLDMIFIAADGRVVGIHPDATPLSTTAISVGTLSRFVLEVPGGYAARHGIAPGDRVKLDGLRDGMVR